MREKNSNEDNCKSQLRHFAAGVQNSSILVVQIFKATLFFAMLYRRHVSSVVSRVPAQRRPGYNGRGSCYKLTLFGTDP